MHAVYSKIMKIKSSWSRERPSRGTSLLLSVKRHSRSSLKHQSLWVVHLREQGDVYRFHLFQAILLKIAAIKVVVRKRRSQQTLGLAGLKARQACSKRHWLCQRVRLISTSERRKRGLVLQDLDKVLEGIFTNLPNRVASWSWHNLKQFIKVRTSNCQAWLVGVTTSSRVSNSKLIRAEIAKLQGAKLSQTSQSYVHNHEARINWRKTNICSLSTRPRKVKHLWLPQGLVHQTLQHLKGLKSVQQK